MAKPTDAETGSPKMPVEPVTPGPEIEIDPVTPPPDLDGNGTRGSDQLRNVTPAPVPPTWAAQPVHPMPEESTVPLPVEEVEFADNDEDLEEDLGGPGQPLSLRPDGTDSGPLRPIPGPPPVAARLTPPPMPAGEAPSLRPPPLVADPGRDAGTPPSDGRAPRGTPPPAPSAEPPRTGRPAAGSPALPLLPPGASWSEALSQRPRKKRLKPWFEEVFDEDYLRTLPFMTPEQTLREVAFIKDSLRPPAEGELLDVGCGYGRHAIELGQGGYRVTGIDLSLPLLIRAADESQRRSLSVNFVHADMREMAFDNQFDGAYSFLTSFGYFDEETNLRVATSICRALKPGGRFLVDVINRDYIVSDLPTRVWWEGEGCVVLEEVDFNFQTNRLTVRRSIVFQDGRQVEHDISIRAYSLHELAKLLRQAGFRVMEVSGGVATRGHFFGSTSRSVIVLCERPAE
jgi:SAM-dependent methyltransferase